MTTNISKTLGIFIMSIFFILCIFYFSITYLNSSEKAKFYDFIGFSAEEVNYFDFSSVVLLSQNINLSLKNSKNSSRIVINNNGYMIISDAMELKNIIEKALMDKKISYSEKFIIDDFYTKKYIYFTETERKEYLINLFK